MEWSHWLHVMSRSNRELNIIPFTCTTASLHVCYSVVSSNSCWSIFRPNVQVTFLSMVNSLSCYHVEIMMFGNNSIFVDNCLCYCFYVVSGELYCFNFLLNFHHELKVHFICCLYQMCMALNNFKWREKRGRGGWGNQSFSYGTWSVTWKKTVLREIIWRKLWMVHRHLSEKKVIGCMIHCSQVGLKAQKNLKVVFLFQKISL